MKGYLLIEADEFFDGETIGTSIRVLVSPEGRIEALNPRDGDLPTAVERVKGKFLSPGLIDIHSHVGLHGEAEGWAGLDVNEKVDPVTPHLRAIDAVNPYDLGFRDAIEGGVTTLNVVPGSANPIGGQGVLLSTWQEGERIIDEMAILSPSCLKMATGENPKRVYQEQKRIPFTRMGVAGIIRETFIKALNYKAKLEKGEAERDIVNEVLVEVLKGNIPVHVHAHRSDDIVTAVRIAKEFGLRLAIVHGTEGGKVASYLAKENVPVMVGPSLSSRVKRELEEISFETPYILYKAGVLFSITADAPVVPIKYLNLLASLSAAAGLPQIEALKGVTYYPVRIMEISGFKLYRGLIREGYVADLVLWSEFPLSWSAKPEKVFVRGQEALRRR